MPEQTAGQLLSHSGLLQRADAPDIVDRRLDAIIVPSARPAGCLVEAAGYAEELNAPLMVLASRHARGDEIIREIEDNGIVVDMIVVDLPGRLWHMPELETDKMLNTTPFSRDTDVSTKRNLGLLLARAIGWRRIMFLDDDIKVPNALDLRRAVGALSKHAAVGLHIGGFPDNSVVCHARRELGDEQGTFVGGGALAVPAYRNDEAFFPNIYNEDWFFLLDDARIRTVSLVGEVVQRPYDPFVNPDRARGEEFGDTLAEGIFAALSGRGTIADVLNDGYWVGFLAARRRLIEDLLHRAQRDASGPGRAHMIAALKAARGRSFLIEPHDCVRFLLAWKRDRIEWSRAVRGLKPAVGIERALGQFGLGRSATVRLNRTGPAPKEIHLHLQRKRLEAEDRKITVTSR